MTDPGLVDFAEPMLRLFNHGLILGPDGEKMSKSRGNVINPDEVVNRYGADTVRGYLMFIGPWDQGGPWDPQAIEGVYRFLQRVWVVVTDDMQAVQPQAKPARTPAPEQERALERKLHQAILKVTDDMQDFRFNTAIATLMELNNYLYKARETDVVNRAIWHSCLLYTSRCV